MKPSGIVTLLSDFGLSDGYVASMKGVILSMAPEIRVVDMTHLVEPQDVAGGAFVLASAAPFFPPGSVHVAVVDPGVGSPRLAVAVETEERWLVGPDNGLLLPAAGTLATRAVRIEVVPGYDRPRSATFHGRDLFAPAGAHLARGGALDDLGPQLEPSALEPFGFPEAERSGGESRAPVVSVDHFGNAVTSMRAEDLPGEPKRLLFRIGAHRIRGLVRTYADVDPGAACVLLGSDGYVEVALRDGSAADVLGVSRGDLLVCTLDEESGRRAGS